ncbi:hypothetical protein BASA81_002606 [Batrachochytrium salamandrivorans]|nr:hypothetical protein BASA81_002606 [Batrachochytrium salamandrivorans]
MEKAIKAAGSLGVGLASGKLASLLAYSMTTSSLWHTYSQLSQLTPGEDGLLQGAVTAGVGLWGYHKLTKRTKVDLVLQASLGWVLGDRTSQEFARMNGFQIGARQAGRVQTVVLEADGAIKTVYQVWGSTDLKQGIVACEADVAFLTNTVSIRKLTLDIVSPHQPSSNVRLQIVP